MADDAPTALISVTTRYLLGLRGVVGVAPLPRETSAAALEAETRYEHEAALPIRNAALREGLERTCVLALLKDTVFRGPPMATLYLVEPGQATGSETLVVEGTRYRILGEECGSDFPTPEGALRVSDTFVLYPGRRTDPSRPASFLLPPIPFPELEREPWSRRLRRVVSASPSSEADAVIRAACGFAQDPRLGTLVLGFDPVAT